MGDTLDTRFEEAYRKETPKMKKIWEDLKCFFGIHPYDEDDNYTNGYRWRFCRSCAHRQRRAPQGLSPTDWHDF